MTDLVTTATSPRPVPGGPAAPSRTHLHTGAALTAIAAVQVALALRPGLNRNAFQDEGLYLYMGHRMIDHLLHGISLSENPGSFFSGSPGLYPVLAAVADSWAGLGGARMLSLVFAIVAMLATYRLGAVLVGRRAGLLGAAAFAVCGSVVFQSHLATYDAMALSLFAIAAWLTVRSVWNDQLLWAPVIAAILTVAFFVKYASGVYLPGIALLATAVAWPTRHRWTVAVRAATMVLIGVVLGWAIVVTWGPSIVPGIVSTTLDRQVLAPAGRADLLWSVGRWVGPWLALALAGAVVLGRRAWPTSVVLLMLSVAGPAQQIVIGESTSLAKHVGYGMVFACPLVGLALGRLWGRLRGGGTALAVAVVIGLTGSGWHWSGDFLRGWVDDRALVPVLQADIAASPGKVLLGEEPSAQRYELTDVTAPAMWADTFVFYYDGLEGLPAYRRAIDQSHFGTIFLNLNTPNGQRINDYLSTAATPYVLSDQPTAYLDGQPVGRWLVWTPAVLQQHR